MSKNVEQNSKQDSPSHPVYVFLSRLPKIKFPVVIEGAAKKKKH